ncbi:hypothetical protein RchiOBHm_Chr2g0146591 [Rosa chinensis]|uniref:Uncharacterized protein n=1 Tax=Rosa chinensis TaxID=74649 RepID=A0A2P6RYZ6_ROSCH|nr:hypothetical protein RchiOBHm_Chr2g0146591 [Rosa chinensis]
MDAIPSVSQLQKVHLFFQMDAVPSDFLDSRQVYAQDALKSYKETCPGDFPFHLLTNPPYYQKSH